MQKRPTDSILKLLALGMGALAILGIALIVLTDARPGDEDMLMLRLAGAAFATGGLVAAVAIWRAERWAASVIGWLVAVPLALLAGGLKLIFEDEMALVAMAGALAAGGLAAFVRHRLRARPAPPAEPPRLGEPAAPPVPGRAARREEERAR